MVFMVACVGTILQLIKLSSSTLFTTQQHNTNCHILLDHLKHLYCGFSKLVTPDMILDTYYCVLFERP